MRKVFFLLLIALAIFSFASCSNGPSSDGVTINASSQKDQWFSVGRKTPIEISNMNPSVLYAIRTKNGNTRGIVSRDLDSSDSILTTDAGTHIPIPDENNSCNFVGGDIDITSSNDGIQLVELKPGTDFTLHATGEPDFIAGNGARVWEEYYYVDLTQPPYNFTPEEMKRLTLSRVGTGSGSGSSNWAMVSTNFKAIVDEKTGLFGAFDLSGYENVILYNEVGIFSGSDWTQTILLRPTTMVSCDSTTTEINNFYEVLQIDASTASKGKEYVLVLKTYEDGGYAYALKDWSSIMTAYLDGKSRGFAFPISSDESDVTVIYLGEIDQEKDFLIDCHIYNTDQKQRHYADVYVREISDYEKNYSKLVLSPSGTTVVTVDVPAGRSFKYPMIVYTDDESARTDLYVSVNCNYVNDDGTLGDYYGEGYVETYLNMSHVNEIGMSGWGMYGPCSSTAVPHDNLLENFYFYANNTNRDRTLRFTLSFVHSDKELGADAINNAFGWDVIIVPNNGSENYTVRVETPELYGTGTIVAPDAPTRAGYQFKGWSMLGTLYGAGETIEISYFNTLVAVWQKE